MYIRHKAGPGASDDTVIIAAGLLWGFSAGVGCFLADAIDTLENTRLGRRTINSSSAYDVLAASSADNPYYAAHKLLAARYARHAEERTRRFAVYLHSGVAGSVG
jgi:hypothetical protein